MDRNRNFATCCAVVLESLSARRAWIEILSVAIFLLSLVVALRKESVDRNNDGAFKTGKAMRRSPQGERG